MRTQTPIKHKTDLKELYILSFYFHAFDFIIGIECNFAESRDTLKRGLMAPCLAAARFSRGFGNVELVVSKN